MLLQIPNVLSKTEVDSLRSALLAASFDDGASSAGPMARDAKRNLQLALDAPAARQCAPVILSALQRNPLFFSSALPHRLHGPLFNRYDEGMTYGPHIDNAMMGSPSSVRTDLAATLFLTALADYDGGELTVQDSFGAHRVKLEAGSMIVYPASSLHWVEPVRRGSRLSAVMWIQSLVRDEKQRGVLLELDMAIGGLRQKGPAAPELDALTAVYHNLLRMWAEP